MPVLPVVGIILIKSHAMVSMAIGRNGQPVTSLVFTKINNQFEPGNGDAMIQSRIQVYFSQQKFVMIS